MVEAQELKCGDRFQFRDRTLLVFSAFTDVRHTQTIVTCISENEIGKVYVLRLFRTFMVELLQSRMELQLEMLHNTEEEVLKSIAIGLR